MSPFLAGICASVTCSRKSSRSGVTIMSLNVSAIQLCRCFQSFGVLQHIFFGALKQKGLLGNVVVLLFDDFFEASNRIGKLDILAGKSGKRLGYMEGLREESLEPARTLYGGFVLIGQFINTQNGDDVL